MAANYDKLSEINSTYQNSMTLLNKALGEDERENLDPAIEYYLKALKFLEDGVRVDIGGPEYHGAEWGVARQQQEKMLKAHVKTKQRLYDLQERQRLNASSAPAYSESLPEGHTSLAVSVDGCLELNGTTELLTIPGGVQMFLVSEDHHVGTTTPHQPSFLRVLVIDATEEVFLQVSEWTYPLVRSKTPVFKSNAGAYLFPNQISGTIAQGCIGLVISSEVNHNLVETFENVLQNLALFRHQGESGEVFIDLSESVHVPTTSDKIAAGIVKGAEWMGYGLSKGAQFTTDMVMKGSEKLKENLNPNNEPSNVNSTVHKGLYYTHEASKATVRVSKFLVDGLCAITAKVGQEVAPHVKEYSKKILPESVTSKDESGESTMDGVIKVAGAGLEGLGTVWTELEKSGLAIARAVSSATVQNVEYKYGKDAGIAATNAMGSVVNVGKTAFNLDHLGMKAVAKRAAKDTGKAVMKEYSVDQTKDQPKEKELK